MGTESDIGTYKRISALYREEGFSQSHGMPSNKRVLCF